MIQDHYAVAPVYGSRRIRNVAKPKETDMRKDGRDVRGVIAGAANPEVRTPAGRFTD